MTPVRVFLDTGIFIALLSRRDQRHKQAVSLFSGPRPLWFTSILVWSEAYAWFLHRHGEETARSFRNLVASLEGLQILATNATDHEAALRMLDRMRGSRLTYVDASSLALMERYEIRIVWSTDFHLALAGAAVLPRS